MKRKAFTALVALSFWTTEGLKSQDLQPTVWQAYGIRFQAPKEYTVEDDSEEGYTLSTSDYYISIQLLEGDHIRREEIPSELTHIAEDDQLSHLSQVKNFELPQFYGASLTGESGTDQCLYSYILTKDDTGGFYVSIIYSQKDDPIPQQILNSFMLED